MEKLYDSGGMLFTQRCSLALWLFETHETEVTDGTGMRNIPNFIFGSIELVYMLNFPYSVLGLYLILSDNPDMDLCSAM